MQIKKPSEPQASPYSDDPRHIRLLGCVLKPEMHARWLVLNMLAQEWQRIPHKVSEAMMGFIRLAWWRELLEEIIQGKTPRPHPLASQLQSAADFLKTNEPALMAWHEAQGAMLEPALALADDEWQSQAAQLEGGRLWLAAQLWQATPEEAETWHRIGEAWAILWLLIELPVRIARREKWLPVSLMEAVDADAAEKTDGTHIRAEVQRWAESLQGMLTLPENLSRTSQRMMRAHLSILRYYLHRLEVQRYHPWPPIAASRVRVPLRLMLGR